MNTKALKTNEITGKYINSLKELNYNTTSFSLIETAEKMLDKSKDTNQIGNIIEMKLIGSYRQFTVLKIHEILKPFGIILKIIILRDEGK